MNINILKYESEVWKTADLLIGAGIKQSDFPKYMMPFFAHLMVESRLTSIAKEIATLKELPKALINNVVTGKIKVINQAK